MHFTLSDLVTDIAQNSLEANSTHVELDFIETDKEIRFIVKDDGKGMTEDELKRALDPFVTDGVKHPNRKVGLGLPFLTQTTEQSGGGCDIKSEKGKGTTVTAWFDSKNVDTPPTGSVPSMFRTILTHACPAEIVIRRKKITDEYEVSKSDLIDVLGSFEEVSSLVLLGDYLKSLESD